MSDLSKLAQEELVKGGVALSLTAAAIAAIIGAGAAVTGFKNKKRRRQIQVFLEEHYEEVSELEDDELVQCLMELKGAGVEYPQEFHDLCLDTEG